MHGLHASRKDTLNTVKDGNERGGKRPLKKQPSSAALSLALTHQGGRDGSFTECGSLSVFVPQCSGITGSLFQVDG
jgi:hypothetical protein